MKVRWRRTGGTLASLGAAILLMVMLALVLAGAVVGVYAIINWLM